MNKTYMWIAVGIGCVAVAISATMMFWPRHDPESAGVSAGQRTPPSPARRPADFHRATVLTATVPSTLPSTLPRSLPSNESPLGLGNFDPPESAVPTEAFSAGSSISFMPERLSLSENSQWQNGWDEPVTEAGAGLLARLPDWSSAAEWLTPGGRVADGVSGLAEAEPKMPQQRVSAMPATIPLGDDSIYTVRSRDTFWTISQKVYGTGALFAALAEHNRGAVADPRELKVGQTIAMPPATWLAERYPHLYPEPAKQKGITPMPTAHDVRRPEHAVKQGDTLERIAVIRLGRADRWREILALNHDVVGASGSYLRPGTVLAMPDDARSAATVLRPTDGPR